MLRKVGSQARRALVVATFGASLLLAQDGAALAAGLTIDPAGTTYTHRCDGDGVLMNVQVVTGDEAPPAGENLFVSLDADVLTGGAVVPDPMPATILVALSPHTPPPGGSYATLAGSHTIHLRMGGANADASIVIPPDYCAIPVTPPPNSPGKPKPGVEDSATARSGTSIAIAASLKVAAPTNLRSANGGADCAAHVGLIGALVCPDLINSGKLLLVWDWQAATGPEAIDGYRLYHTNGISRQPTLVDTVRNGKDQTLVLLGRQSSVANTLSALHQGGAPDEYNGRCYAVSAFAGARESDLSNIFCASSGSVAKTTRLYSAAWGGHERSSGRVNQNGNFSVGAGASPPGLLVGYQYLASEHTLGDKSHADIHRAAVAFDVSALRIRKLVAAKLRMQIVESQVGEETLSLDVPKPQPPPLGNNHSCATDVGTGTEFWWKNTGWIEGQFFYNVVPTDTGPVITADVTPIVASWLRGEPNYGFVLKNDDENLNAFTNKICLTWYINLTLEITYY